MSIARPERGPGRQVNVSRRVGVGLSNLADLVKDVGALDSTSTTAPGEEGRDGVQICGRSRYLVKSPG